MNAPPLLSRLAETQRESTTVPDLTLIYACLLVSAALRCGLLSSHEAHLIVVHIAAVPTGTRMIV